ncbi:hypothetical protein SASPL_106953 [Salvia splendens]|uniref:Uncharacterized protein n=1 Tax=Salvia splendens TaxID=180675 RepID=A0A8X8YC41_SALSN|nr:hypothetical protein SASPL_106953 [Salvia splendens]
MPLASPIGLNLEITESFLNELESASRVAQDKVDVRHSHDKIRASHVQITTFTVGNWKPRKPTIWKPVDDFTGGQALLCRFNVFSNRKHEVTFLPGVLDKHYEQLLINDEHLAELSRRPLPNHDKHLTELRLFSGPADFSSQKALVAHDQRLDQHSDVGTSSQNPIVAPASTYVDSSSSQNSSVVPDQHLHERNDMVGGGNEASSTKRQRVG